MMRWILIMTMVLFGFACDSEKASKPAAKEAEKSATAKQSADAAGPSFTPAEGWQIVDHDNPSAEVKALLEPAKKAQGHLGIRLIGELSRAVNSKGAAEAVQVCNVEVDGIRQGVEAEFGVDVGRTSHKLRNPKNTPPTFMKPIVEARYPQPVALEGPDGEIGWSFPLRLGPICANCHGKDDKIAPGVNERVAELYPEDEATGFEVGELRGWIWAISKPKS